MNKGGESAETARGTGRARAHRPSSCAAHRLASPWHPPAPRLPSAKESCGPDRRSQGHPLETGRHIFFRTQEGTRAPGGEDRKSAPQTFKAPRCFVCLDDKGQDAGATVKEMEAQCAVAGAQEAWEAAAAPPRGGSAQSHLRARPPSGQSRRRGSRDAVCPAHGGPAPVLPTPGDLRARPPRSPRAQLTHDAGGPRTRG